MTSCPGAILVLVGTKAQFIKTAPILREFDRRGTRYRLIYTGQHRETFDSFGRRSPAAANGVARAGASSTATQRPRCWARWR